MAAIIIIFLPIFKIDVGLHEDLGADIDLNLQLITRLHCERLGVLISNVYELDIFRKHDVINFTRWIFVA